MKTKWQTHPKLRTDSNLNNIGEGICRVRHESNPQVIAKIKSGYEHGGERWLVIIEGLTVASCGSPGAALKVCEAHLAV